MASLPNPVVRFDGTPQDYKLVQDRKRDLDYRNKYANGAIVRVEGAKPNQRVMQPARAPVKIPERKHYLHKSHPRYAVKDKEHLTTDSSSTEDDIHESPEGAAPDADIAYSYDATKGPTQGRDILGMAMDKAVERFETKATEKLVKDEYDVLAKRDYEDDDIPGCYADDEFELI